MNVSDTRELKLYGIGASDGISIGQAYLVDKKGVDVIKRYVIQERTLANEIKRFKTAVSKSNNELRAVIEASPEELRQHANIYETHIALLKDKMLYGRTIAYIEKERVNAEWALKKVIANIKLIFQNMDDSYLRERIVDIEHVSELILRNLVGAKQENLADIDRRVILVADDLSPADTSQINLKKIMGFITDGGSKTSHTGIIARTLGIPAVMGLETATRMINTEDIIIADGTQGTVIVHPSEKTILLYQERQNRFEQRKAVIARNCDITAETSDGFRVKVMGNIELPEEVVAVRDHGGDGIGLYRTEFQYLRNHAFPGEATLFNSYKDVVEKMYPNQVTFRTLDINGDKVLRYHIDNYHEDNPALGLRAIRYCLKHPNIFKIQLRAILRAAAYGNVRILIPMISNCFEIKETRRLLDEAAASLAADGLLYKRDIEVGIMIEVPAAVIMADVMAPKVDFFSLGTNDLIQYTLAIDRGNRQVAHLFNPLHPAIVRMLKSTADMAHKHNIGIFICGEMAGDPLYTPLLVGLGIKELSMNPFTIPIIKQTVRSLNFKECQQFTHEILQLADAAEIAKRLQQNFGAMYYEEADVCEETVNGKTA
ncbi:phosphoenolpyruvate--protein phosphotransferase [Desulfococcaceae bacterium HSG7]|nr:phosphoenolpyruvate--protein phosphotransferase [Desulfococcaceae bacterium HSG7]